MKHIFQKLAITVAICTSALFTSCQKDDSISTEQSIDNASAISKITFEEFKKHPKAFNEFEKLDDNIDGLRPKLKEYGDDYYYETDEVTLIEYSDERYSYKSYIFPIYRDIPSKNIENLLIWEKSTGETNSYILTYYLSESDWEAYIMGKPIFLGDKTQIVPIQKSAPDPYVLQAADGRCGVYSGIEPDYADYFAMNVEGTIVYFDVVNCSQYVIDYSLMQGNNNGGSTGGGGNAGYGDDGWSVGVVYFPIIPGSGDGNNDPVTDPDDLGGYYTYNPVEHTPVSILSGIFQEFYNGLDNDEQQMELLSNPDLRDGIIDLVTVFDSYQEEAFALAKKIIELSRVGYEDEALSVLDFLTDENQNTIEDIQNINELLEITNVEITIEVFDSNIFNMAMEVLKGNYLSQPFDTEYYNAIDSYTPENLHIYWPTWQSYFAAQCAIIKSQHPEYSSLRVYWEASKEMVHIALDVVGLVPAFGEVADLANGIIYTIEGDGVNASLSFAATAPVAGWAAMGTKYARKAVQITSTTKTTLHWTKVSTNITFGKSTQLRKVLNLTSTSVQAHHIIPWGLSNHYAIQKAASKRIDAFHMNEALNGIPLDNSIHMGSHPAYSNRVTQRLNEISPNATPEQAYEEVLDLVNDIRAAILANPNTHINNLIF